MTAPSKVRKNVLEAGLLVHHRRQRHVIVKVLDTETILVRNLESGGIMRVAALELDPGEAFTHLEQQALDLSLIADGPWQAAKARLSAIEPLLPLPRGGRTQARVDARAAEVGVHPATLYRWIDAYETSSNKLSSLLVKERRDKGAYKIDTAAEVIVQEVIDELYLTRERRGYRTVVREIEKRCRERGVKVPHYNTVRKRVQDRSTYVVTARRLGRKEARDKYRPDTQSFPGADFPLSVVQMDHVKLDIELVDDQDGQPIGRAWLTVMICVHTRMIPGFYLSLDSPNSFAVGMCIGNAILPKDELLAKHHIDAHWPIEGFPRVLHTDNAREFHSAALERACEEYGIIQEYRPRGRPEFGGHVERLARTFNNLLHEEKGTTFGSIAKRGSYDSAANAIFTLDRLEEWIVQQIKIYHGTFHSGIQTTPLQRFLDAQSGDDTQPGVGAMGGLSTANLDVHRMRLDFMPSFEHTIQNYGVQFKGVRFYHDVLRPWIKAPDPDHVGRYRKFLFRYDPRLFHQVYFYDPELRDYLSIPYRDTSRARVSVWEIQAAKRHAKSRGKAAENEDELFAAHDDLQRIRDTAAKETKQRRRTAQRKRQAKPVVPDEYFEKQAAALPPPTAADLERIEVYVEGFDEVDFG